MLKALSDILLRYRALWCGIALLCGILYTTLSLPLWHLTYPIAFGMLGAFFLYRKARQWSLALVAFFCYGALTTSYYYTFPDTPPEGIQGTAYITLERTHISRRAFSSYVRCNGTLHHFHCKGGGVEARNVPYTLSLPHKAFTSLSPTLGSEYSFACTLQKNAYNDVLTIIRPHKGSPWRKVSSSGYSLEALRSDVKISLKDFLATKISHDDSRAFLSGLLIGSCDDAAVLFSLKKCGLLHLLAISGFHFSFLAMLLHFFLRRLMSPKASASLLILLATLYFLFIGPMPSIQRAWITLIIYQAGIVCGKTTSSLNILGLALATILLIDPLAYSTLGFQFSFLATASILLLYNPFLMLFGYAFEKKKLREVLQRHPFRQYLYIFLSLLRNSLALTCAVHCAAIPFSLYSFHLFPVISIIFNLFFPFFTTFAMVMVIASFVFHLCIPWLGVKLFHLVDMYTHLLLRLPMNTPAALDISLRSSSLPLSLLVCYLCTLFGVGVWLSYKHSIYQKNILI
jgi:competence protein ComEC